MLPTPAPFRRLAVVALVAVATSVVAGCGRKGDPELPTTQPPPAASDRPVGFPIGMTQKKPPEKKPVRPFALDFLL